MNPLFVIGGAALVLALLVWWQYRKAPGPAGGQVVATTAPVPVVVPATSVPKKSLFDRLGGIYAISAVVNRFSDRLINNRVVGVNSANPQLSDWSRNKLDRLPGLKFMRTLWLAEVAGGPYKFQPSPPPVGPVCPFMTPNGADCRLNLTTQHCPLKISGPE